MRTKLLFTITIGFIFLACNPNKMEFSEQEISGEWVINKVIGHNVRQLHKTDLKFDKGKLFGSLGCNNFFAEYKLGLGKSIRIEAGSTTDMECDAEFLTEQEQYLSKFLGGVNSFKIQDNNLHLVHENKQELVLLRK